MFHVTQSDVPTLYIKWKQRIINIQIPASTNEKSSEKGLDPDSKRKSRRTCNLLRFGRNCISIYMVFQEFCVQENLSQGSQVPKWN